MAAPACARPPEPRPRRRGIVVVLTVLNEVVLRAIGVDEMRPMLYGAILILFILFLPNGLESLVPKAKDWFGGRKQKQAKSEQPAEAEQTAK